MRIMSLKNEFDADAQRGVASVFLQTRTVALTPPLPSPPLFCGVTHPFAACVTDADDGSQRLAQKARAFAGTLAAGSA